MFFDLQRIVFPSNDFGAPEDLYARFLNDRAVPADGKEVRFEKRGSVLFDTYFNSLSVEFWKNHCNIRNVYLRLNGVGEFRVRVGLWEVLRDAGLTILSWN